MGTRIYMLPSGPPQATPHLPAASKIGLIAFLVAPIICLRLDGIESLYPWG